MSLDKLIPQVKAKEEEEEEEAADLVDPAVAIKAKCGEDAHCSKYKEKLEECNSRVASKKQTTETCVEEILDFYHCVDHCAGPKIFKVLK